MYTYQSSNQVSNENFLYELCDISTCVIITTSYLHLPYYDCHYNLLNCEQHNLGINHLTITMKRNMI